MNPRRTLLPVLAVAALLLAACGDDEPTPEAEAPEPVQCPQPTQPAPVETPAELTELGKPTIEVPDAPATELEVVDLVEGDGAEVEECDVVIAHYVGVGQSSGEEFDSSWGRGEPAAFPINAVIPGWSEGLLGMKEGGRRELIIPGDLAYGANPPGPDIQPDETLVFVVDLIAVEKPV